MSPIRRSQPVLERSLQTGNSSNTNPPAQAPAKKTEKKTLTVLPHVPNEIILTIVRQLGFKDLKSARLLSKAWSFCASPFLFVNLSVSPSKEDLEVFEAITQHPQLSKCIRHLWYVGSDFLLHLSKTWYLHQLHRQLSPLHVTILKRAWANKLDNSDSEINSWLQTLDSAEIPMPFKDVLAMYGSSTFVNDGYQKYHEHAIYQQNCIQDGTLIRRLVKGFKQLDHLKSVTLECGWDSDTSPLEPCKGSQLARSWSVFHCRPAKWDWVPLTELNSTFKAGNGAEHYRILVSALGLAQRRIRAFQIGPDKIGPKTTYAIPPYLFDASVRDRNGKPLQFHNDNVIAFSGVEELGLRFAAYGSQDTPKLFDNIADLPAILKSMDHLKHLELRLPDHRNESRLSRRLDHRNDFRSSYYSYNQVFPKNLQWESLKLLKLFSISVAATDFVLLLLDAMPQLKHLEMGEIKLSRGSWQSIFEALKQMHRLRVLILPVSENLYHHGDRLVQDLSRTQVVYRQFSAYVMIGKRHPSLSPGQPDSAARDYTRDLGPVLQQRLLDLDSANPQKEHTAWDLLLRIS